MLRPMALVGCLALLAGCSTTSYDSVSGRGYRAEGTASYYGKAHHGKRTASGERFNQNALTAAHRTLAFGTRVKVTNLDNGRSVVVRINDRGPFGRGRIIDVSKAAAEQLNMLRSGTARVRLEGL
ncbi:septal ring lytic transglycosylase RlpA family protein [Pseudomonas nitroreducens]|uniref:septal ring lytic transglycosylase RlpA family protein n=1 Tax=Pseudomonas nitroreducens TaxID=46680 RepID=UPI0037FCA145